MQNWPDGYQNKIEDILGEGSIGGKTTLSFEMENLEEAKLLKKKLILMQKQLRQIRKEANAEMNSVRSHYGDQTKSVEAGFFSSLFGGAGRDRENKRRDIRNKRDNELNKFRNVKDTIDGILLQIDSAKIQIDEIIMKGEL